MKKLIALITIIVSVCVNCNGQRYYYPWKNEITKKNCDFRITLEFADVATDYIKALYPFWEYDWEESYWCLYADTLSNKEIVYTIYLYCIKNEKTNKYDYITKTGTIEELKYWAKNPYFNIFKAKFKNFLL